MNINIPSRNVSGQARRDGRPTRGNSWFKTMVSCVFPCFSHTEAAEEVDISTPYRPRRVPSFEDDESTVSNLGLKAARRRHAQGHGRRRCRRDQPSSNVDDQMPTSSDPQPAVVAQDDGVVEVDVTAANNMDTDEQGSCVDAQESPSDMIRVDDEGSIGIADRETQSEPGQELVVFCAEVAHPGQPGPTAGRVSRDSDEVQELEKVEAWQRGRAVLGKNNLLRHNCHPAATRRRGIFDYYNQKHVLVGHEEEMTTIIFSGPSS